MIRWKVELSNGEVVEEGVMPWVELPGERLPWPRLCAYLEENNLYVTKFWALNGPNDLFQRQDFQSCFVEYDMELDNIMGGPTATTSLHTGFYYEGLVDHIYIDMETGELTVKRTDTYKAMMPSRKNS
jgi:hypothetical protein